MLLVQVLALGNTIKDFPLVVKENMTDGRPASPPSRGIKLHSIPGKTLVVGDIHGCFDELLFLIGQAGLCDGDRIVAVGDLIDRGDQAWQVVDFFMSKPESRFAVCGNHEWKHILHRASQVMPSRLGNLTKAQMGAERHGRAVEYFKTLPLWIELPEVIVAHAGVCPGERMEETDPKLIMGVASDYRTGFDGSSPWWFDDPALNIGKPIVFGHHVFPAVERGIRGNVWGINTGAGYGLPLTGLLLPDFKVLSVPTKDRLASLPPRWTTVEELGQLEVLGWKALEKLGARREELPPAAAEAICDALRRLREEEQRIQEKGERLREEYGIGSMDRIERGETLSRLKQDFVTPAEQCLFQAIKGHQVLETIKKLFPNVKELRRLRGEK